MVITYLLFGLILPALIFAFGMILPHIKMLGKPKYWYIISVLAALWFLLSILFALVLFIAFIVAVL